MATDRVQTTQSRRGTRSTAAANANMADGDDVLFTRPATTTGETASVESDVLSAMHTSLGKAMEELGNVSKLLHKLQADIDKVKKDTAGLRVDVNGVIQRLEVAEGRISTLEDENASLRPTVEQQAKKCEKLEAALQEANWRDRRQNLLLVGLKENMENGKPEVCVRKIIGEALGIQLDQAQLQRVHRVPGGPVWDETRPPRPIVMRFLCFLEKEKVFAAARSKYRSGQGVEWKGCRLSFFQDLPREWTEKRKKFKDVKEKLHAMDVRFTVAPPAQMRFTWNGKRMKFDDHRQAMRFLNIPEPTRSSSGAARGADVTGEDTPVTEGDHAAYEDNGGAALDRAEGSEIE